MPDTDSPDANDVREPAAPGGLSPEILARLFRGFGEEDILTDYNVETLLYDNAEARRNAVARITLVRAVHALAVADDHPLRDVVAIAKILASRLVDGISQEESVVSRAFLVLVIALVGRQAAA